MPRNWRTAGVALSSLPWMVPPLVLTVRSSSPKCAPAVSEKPQAALKTKENRMVERGICLRRCVIMGRQKDDYARTHAVINEVLYGIIVPVASCRGNAVPGGPVLSPM
jgi:hypothetical protein